MEKRIKAGFLAILALALAVSFAGTLYRAVFSSYDSLFYENRSAAPLPKADFASLWDGAYMTDLDEYLSDQYIARTRLIKAQTFLDLLLQRPVVNDIVVGEDLLLPFHGYSYYGAQDFTTEAAEAAGELARLEEVVEANGGELFYLCIPEQSSYFRDEYPENMDNHAETLDAMSAAFTGAMASAGLRLIDAGEVYAAEGSPRDYYLNTDHHYSCRGMLSAYTALMNAVNSATGLGLRVYSEADLTLETLENPVLGSLDRKLFGLYGTQERLVLPHLNESIPFTRTDNGESVAAELFDIPADGELAAYGVYMGGDVGETVIDTDRPELPSLLLWGDSYSNAMETLLWASFDEARYLDYRYFYGAGLSEYIERYKPDVVVCIRDDLSILNSDGNGPDCFW